MPGCPRSSVAARGTRGAESASGRGWLARTPESWGISTSVRNRRRPSRYPENATWQMQDPEAITPQPGDGSRRSRWWAVKKDSPAALRSWMAPHGRVTACPGGTGMAETADTYSLVALLWDATEMGLRTERKKQLA